MTKTTLPGARARAITAVVAGLAAAACASRGDPVETSYDPSSNLPDGSEYVVCSSCGACEERVEIRSANHVDTGPIEYPDPPPAGGDHRSCWAKWGVHTEAVPPERWVHNLEHGGIVFAYDCAADGCAQDQLALAQLGDLVQRRAQTLMTPYPGLPKRFAVISWGHRLVSDCIDVEAAAAFYALHVNRAPESIAGNPDPSCDP